MEISSTHRLHQAILPRNTDLASHGGSARTGIRRVNSLIFSSPCRGFDGLALETLATWYEFQHFDAVECSQPADRVGRCSRFFKSIEGVIRLNRGHGKKAPSIAKCKVGKTLRPFADRPTCQPSSSTWASPHSIFSYRDDGSNTNSQWLSRIT